MRPQITFSNYDLRDLFEEELNETCTPFRIAGLTYLAGMSLREIDPVAFRKRFWQWVDISGYIYIGALDEWVHEDDIHKLDIAA